MGNFQVVEVKNFLTMSGNTILGLSARCALRSALALALISASASAEFLETLSASATLAERMR
jgi:hypothetical protein